MSANLERIEALFTQALEFRPEERGAFLAGACGQDSALIARVHLLLDAHGAAEGFLPEEPRKEPVAGLIAEKAGDRIGRYKLRERIGEGGCGVVYVAEQEEPVRRKVALKIIKLGMDTRNVVARFQAERQALALMDHPNIAQVHDAGATETGRPYFVMELVRGIKITDYCDQHQLSTRERLELFIKVCQAVQHAHQKGVIHRDIKPSNILVTVNDGVPVPKVIDFGIAKATTGRLTDLTVYTDLHQFIGTPAYMSPEQATMTSLDIDTRSDIYSLGVLLYELLTSHTPFDTKELMALEVDALRRTIREREPLRPSTRLSTMLEGELTTTAKHRASAPPGLIHQVRGDLDWIVMKCLEKDRTRRYDTANGLAMDIQRHLNNEPVVARPPSKLYRLQKTVQRNKAAFATVVAIIAVLILGAVASMSEAIRARRAERDQSRLSAAAQTEAAKSKQVAQFLKDMLNGVSPGVARGRDTRLLREILDQTAQRLDTELKGQPAVEADLQETLGEAYGAIGDFTNALAMNRKALALREKLYGKEHPDVASSLHNISGALGSLGRLTEAETYCRQALAMRQKLLGPTNLAVAQSLWYLGGHLMAQKHYAEAETNLKRSLALRKKLQGEEDLEFAETLTWLGNALFNQGRLAESEAAARQALAIHVKQHAYEHPVVIQILGNLGWVLRAQGKLSEADAAFREAVDLGRRVLQPGHPDIRHPLMGLANSLKDQGKFAEAEGYIREALTLTKKVRGEHHPDLAPLYDGLCGVLREQGKSAEAEVIQRELVTIQCQLLKKGDTGVIQLLGQALGDLGYALQSRGGSASADPVFGEAVDVVLHSPIDAKKAANLMNELAWALATAENPTSRDAATALELAQTAVSATDRKDDNLLDTLAAAYAAAGQFTNAVRIEQEAIALSKTGRVDPYYAAKVKLYQSNSRCRDTRHLNERASAWLVPGKYAEAESLVRTSLAIEEKQYPDLWWTFCTRDLLGASLLGQRKYEAAEPLLLSAYEGMKQHADQMPLDGKQYLRGALQRLVQLYEETNRPGQAAEWKKQLAELDTDKK
jgi:serine/threonine protein kinase/tetratricopeptide (TPR) repeat protein